MAFTFPTFNESLGGDRSWTGTFDSYDQRNDDVYYVITLFEDGKQVARFMAQVGIAWAGDDWTGPELTERLRRDLAEVAASGTTNTSYTGPMVPNR